MPCCYKILSQHGLLLARCSGVVTLREVLEFLDRVQGDPHFLPGMDGFGDMTEIEEIQISEQEIQQIGWLAQAHYRRQGIATRSAIYAPTKPSHAAALIYAELLAPIADRDVRVFTEMEPALAFLGGGLKAARLREYLRQTVS